MKFLFAFCVSFALALCAGFILLPQLKKLKANQPILHYVEEHKQKTGTPTMGGLFFIIAIVLTYAIFAGAFNKTAVLVIAIVIGYAIIGFLDDFVKIKYKDNKGLSPVQKIIFQLAIAFMVGFYVWQTGQTFLLPFFNIEVSLGFFTIPVVVIVFLAVTNGVNLTDGLDGLCGASTFFYVIIFGFLLFFDGESLLFSERTFAIEDNSQLILLCAIVAGSLLAYLQFNAHKAKVFMGDVGSLALGGFVASTGVMSKFLFFIPFLGITYLISCLSVMIQVAYFKKTKGKRVFLMAPYHHHLQMKGKSETQIMFFYIALTVIVSLLTIAITYIMRS